MKNPMQPLVFLNVLNVQRLGTNKGHSSYRAPMSSLPYTNPFFVMRLRNPSEKTGTMPMPHVLQSPLRPDLVREVHRDMAKNKRQLGLRAAVGKEVGEKM